MSMDDYRSKIDAIDEEIVKKLEERMRVAEEIARYKKNNELPVLDAMREREKIDKGTDRAVETNRGVVKCRIYLSKLRCLVFLRHMIRRQNMGIQTLTIKET